jgi:hypothetical protein
VDIPGIRHVAEVRAESLYEAAILAVRTFKAGPWIENIGPATPRSTSRCVTGGEACDHDAAGGAVGRRCVDQSEGGRAEGEIEDDVMRLGTRVARVGVGGCMAKKAGAKKAGGRKKAAKRELIDTGKDKRFVRRAAGGKFKESDDMGKSLTVDRRKKAKTKVKSGQGDKGDR